MSTKGQQFERQLELLKAQGEYRNFLDAESGSKRNRKDIGVRIFRSNRLISYATTVTTVTEFSRQSLNGFFVNQLD